MTVHSDDPIVCLCNEIRLSEIVRALDKPRSPIINCYIVKRRSRTSTLTRAYSRTVLPSLPLCINVSNLRCYGFFFIFHENVINHNTDPFTSFRRIAYQIETKSNRTPKPT